MEPTKTQSSALFTYSKIDFRDKLEEVSEKFKFFPSNFTSKEKKSSPAIFFYLIF